MGKLRIFFFQGCKRIGFASGVFNREAEYTIGAAIDKPKVAPLLFGIRLIDNVIKFDMADRWHIEPRPPRSTQLERRAQAPP